MMKWLLITLVKGYQTFISAPLHALGGTWKRLPLYTHLFPVLHPGRPHPRRLARLSSWLMAYFKMQPVGRIRL